MVPVFVMRLGEEGILLMMEDARSAGGCWFDGVAMLRLDNNDKNDNIFYWLINVRLQGKWNESARLGSDKRA